MFKEHAELKARADDCVAQARREMELAEQATEEVRCTEHLDAALEWLKVATQFRELEQATGDAPGGPTPTIIPAPALAQTAPRHGSASNGSDMPRRDAP